MRFNTKEDFNDYISRETYLMRNESDAGYIPICYGLSIEQDENDDWEVEIFMNDYTSQGPFYAGIPNQLGSSWSNTATVPDLNSF